MRSQPPATTSGSEHRLQVARDSSSAQHEPVDSRLSEPVQLKSSHEDDQNVISTISQLHSMFGNNWSFDIVYHTSNRSLTEVRGELRANGAYASETGTNDNYGEDYSAGKRLRAAAEQSFVRCAQKLLLNT